MRHMSTPAEVYEAIAGRLRSRPDVEEGTGFGSSPGLRIHRKIFVMLVRGELVVKLPAARCAELAAEGVGRAFENGKGRPMKEWLVLTASPADWSALADEALAFVGGVSPGRDR
jgi:hypothetical protein